MKAFTRDIYGGLQVLRLEEVSKPPVGHNHILVKIKANSANAADWRILRGAPFFARFTYGLFKPKKRIIGSDFSGIVEQVGKNVTDFKVGDRIFGSTLEGGAFAEYISISPDACALMPDEMTFEDMASVPIAGVAALEALTTYGQLKSGESVLINGATGGVGHYAIQIAKAYGAKVTAVCSGNSAAFASKLGADHVIAYDRENTHLHKGNYDLIIDTHGNLSYHDQKRMGKRGVTVGFTTMKRIMSLLFRKSVGKFPVAIFTANLNRRNLEVLAMLVQQGRIKPHIQRTFSYRQTPEAVAYLEAMHTKGKIAMVWES